MTEQEKKREISKMIETHKSTRDQLMCLKSKITRILEEYSRLSKSFHTNLKIEPSHDNQSLHMPQNSSPIITLIDKSELIELFNQYNQTLIQYKNITKEIKKTDYRDYLPKD